jgi:hypothetical protein
LFALTLGGSFGAASYAFGAPNNPVLRSNLQAAQLPTIALDDATSVAVNNLIGAEGVSRFGITAQSYQQARRLAYTAAGAFYLIPGTRGACIVTQSAASCGDPGAAGKPMIALLSTTPKGILVGAGVTVDTTKRVTIASRNGSSTVSLGSARGVFILRESDGVEPASGLEFISGS